MRALQDGASPRQRARISSLFVSPKSGQLTRSLELGIVVLTRCGTFYESRASAAVFCGETRHSTAETFLFLGVNRRARLD